MSKQNNIRWRKSDYSRISHTVRKFNKKVLKLQVTHPDLAEHIPDMIDYKSIKQDIKTRADLNRILNKYNRFLREGAEEIVTSKRGAKNTKWLVKEREIYERVDNMRKAKRRKQLEEREITQGGKKTGIKRAEMGSIKENEVKQSKKKYENMSQSDFIENFRLLESKMRSGYNDEKKKNMKENYILGLIREGYSDELIDIVSKVPIDTFADVVDTDVLADFDFIYDPLEREAKEAQLISLWKRYSTDEEENVNTHNIKSRVYNEMEWEYE